MRRVAILIAIALLTSSVFGFDFEAILNKTEKELEPEEFVVLMKGGTAPFDGVLFSEKKALEYLSMKKELEIKNMLLKEEKKIFMERLKDAERQARIPWYDKPTIRFLLGFSLGIFTGRGSR